MKLPPDLFAGTVSFYRDRLRLHVLEETNESVVFAFGSQKLWLDRSAGLSRPEIWLELLTDDLQAAPPTSWQTPVRVTWRPFLKDSKASGSPIPQA